MVPELRVPSRFGLRNAVRGGSVRGSGLIILGVAAPQMFALASHSSSHITTLFILVMGSIRASSFRRSWRPVHGDT